MANQQQQVVDQDGSRHGRKVGLGEVVVAEGLARAVRALVALFTSLGRRSSSLVWVSLAIEPSDR